MWTLRPTLPPPPPLLEGAPTSPSSPHSARITVVPNPSGVHSWRQRDPFSGYAGAGTSSDAPPTPSSIQSLSRRMLNTRLRRLYIRASGAGASSGVAGGPSSSREGGAEGGSPRRITIRPMRSHSVGIESSQGGVGDSASSPVTHPRPSSVTAFANSLSRSGDTLTESPPTGNDSNQSESRSGGVVVSVMGVARASSPMNLSTRPPRPDAMRHTVFEISNSISATQEVNEPTATMIRATIYSVRQFFGNMQATYNVIASGGVSSHSLERLNFLFEHYRNNPEFRNMVSLTRHFNLASIMCQARLLTLKSAQLEQLWSLISQNLVRFSSYPSLRRSEESLEFYQDIHRNGRLLEVCFGALTEASHDNERIFNLHARTTSLESYSDAASILRRVLVRHLRWAESMLGAWQLPPYSIRALPDIAEMDGALRREVRSMDVYARSVTSPRAVAIRDDVHSTLYQDLELPITEDLLMTCVRRFASLSSRMDDVLTRELTSAAPPLAGDTSPEPAGPSIPAPVTPTLNTTAGTSSNWSMHIFSEEDEDSSERVRPTGGTSSGNQTIQEQQGQGGDAEESVNHTTTGGVDGAGSGITGGSGNDSTAHRKLLRRCRQMRMRPLLSSSSSDDESSALPPGHDSASDTDSDDDDNPPPSSRTSTPSTTDLLRRLKALARNTSTESPMPSGSVDTSSLPSTSSSQSTLSSESSSFSNIMQSVREFIAQLETLVGSNRSSSSSRRDLPLDISSSSTSTSSLSSPSTSSLNTSTPDVSSVPTSPLPSTTLSAFVSRYRRKRKPPPPSTTNTTGQSPSTEPQGRRRRLNQDIDHSEASSSTRPDECSCWFTAAAAATEAQQLDSTSNVSPATTSGAIPTSSTNQCEGSTRQSRCPLDIRSTEETRIHTESEAHGSNPSNIKDSCNKTSNTGASSSHVQESSSLSSENLNQNAAANTNTPDNSSMSVQDSESITETITPVTVDSAPTVTSDRMEATISSTVEFPSTLASTIEATLTDANIVENSSVIPTDSMQSLSNTHSSRTQQPSPRSSAILDSASEAPPRTSEAPPTPPTNIREAPSNRSQASPTTPIEAPAPNSESRSWESVRFLRVPRARPWEAWSSPSSPSRRGSSPSRIGGVEMLRVPTRTWALRESLRRRSPDSRTSNTSTGNQGGGLYLLSRLLNPDSGQSERESPEDTPTFSFLGRDRDRSPPIEGRGRNVFQVSPRRDRTSGVEAGGSNRLSDNPRFRSGDFQWPYVRGGETGDGTAGATDLSPTSSSATVTPDPELVNQVINLTQFINEVSASTNAASTEDGQTHRPLGGSGAPRRPGERRSSLLSERRSSLLNERRSSILGDRGSSLFNEHRLFSGPRRSISSEQRQILARRASLWQRGVTRSGVFRAVNSRSAGARVSVRRPGAVSEAPLNQGPARPSTTEHARVGSTGAEGRLRHGAGRTGSTRPAGTASRANLVKLARGIRGWYQDAQSAPSSSTTERVPPPPLPSTSRAPPPPPPASTLPGRSSRQNRRHRATTRNTTDTDRYRMVKTRSQARHILAMMLRHISSFFQNANLLDVPNHQDPQESFFFHERVYNLHRLLQLALHLTELLYAQLSLSRHLMDNLRSSLNSVTRLQSLLRHRQASSTSSPSANPPGHSRLLQVPTFRPSSRTPILLTRESSVPISVLSSDAAGASSSSNNAAAASGSGDLPQVHLNDMPLPSPPSSPPSYPRTGGGNARFLHPRHVTPPNMFDEGSEEPASERGGAAGLGSNVFLMRGAYGPNSILVPDSYYSPHHRIQAWDFARSNIPDIWNSQKNVVVKECKIHNDASVDISKDGQILVTLLPSGRLSVTTMLGVYSLHWSTLGQCLYTTSFELNAVSVSLSPTSRHLIVGLASRRVSLSSFTDTHTIAQIFRLEGGVPGTNTDTTTASTGSSPNDSKDPSPSSGGKKGRLVRLRHIELPRDTGYMSLNCIRWAPNPGQGLVYGTNTGLLRILE
ncbi:hypothetical protein WDU94_008134 [Cyamophila willieti]